eukprot:gene3362-3851_t
MARDRGASLLHMQVEAASFFGQKVPDVVKKMVPALKNLEKEVVRKLMQIAVKDLEGCEIPNNALKIASGMDMPDDAVLLAFAGILKILKLAFRFPPGTLKQEIFTQELLELRFSEDFVNDISSIIFSSKQLTLDQKNIENRLRLPKLESVKWRVDVGISTSVLNRVLEPTILMEMKLDNNKTATFEVSLTKFHELRYNVSSVLKEMKDLEERSILKI